MLRSWNSIRRSGSFPYRKDTRIRRMTSEHRFNNVCLITFVKPVGFLPPPPCLILMIAISVLMYIHRSFFAQAIIEHPENPLKSQYAPSFLAAYRASSTILKSIGQQFDMWPNSTARFWVMWTFAFTAGVRYCYFLHKHWLLMIDVGQVVFGTVVTRGPRSPLAQSAMSELEKAYILFSKASGYSIRATKALVSSLPLHLFVNSFLTFSSSLS
jgi:hypothetical protein